MARADVWMAPRTESDIEISLQWLRKRLRFANTPIYVGVHEHLRDRLCSADVIFITALLDKAQITKTDLAGYSEESVACMGMRFTPQALGHALGQVLADTAHYDSDIIPTIATPRRNLSHGQKRPGGYPWRLLAFELTDIITQLGGGGQPDRGLHFYMLPL